MKILFLITKSTDGGAQTHISQLAKALIERGHAVAVMSAPGGWLEKEVTRLGGTFFPNAHFKNSYDIFPWPAAKRDIDAALEKFKPDIVSCHSGFAGLMGRLSVHGRVPTIFTAHGWSFSPGSPFLQQALTMVSEHFAAFFCAKIICVSDYDRDLAVRWHVVPKGKLVVVKNGAEIPDVRPEPRTQLRRIVCIGRLAAQKNPLELLKALTLLSPATLGDLEVTFVGDGPDLPMLERFTKEQGLSPHVRFAGSLKRPEVLSLLEHSDAMILPSRKEGLPRSIIEAFARGVPVIASAVGGVPELVLDGSTGFLLPKKNGQDMLAAKLEFLHAHPETLQMLGIQAYDYARREFDLKRMIRETIAVYESLIGPINA